MAQSLEERRAYCCAYEKSERGKAARQRVVAKLRTKEWYRKYDQRRNFKMYSLTEDRFKAILASQSSLCAICRLPNPSKRRRWHIDHDHKTGQVRGVLCVNCNAGLGKFADETGRLFRAMGYLAHHETTTAEKV